MLEKNGRLEVHGSPLRCPYCHADCTPDEPNVVCNRCLARHHRACWQEAGKCGTCGSEGEAIMAVRPAPPRARAQDRLVIEAEIARLDRDWGSMREALLPRNRLGQLIEPSGNEMAAGVLGLVFGIIFAVAGIGSPFPPVALFGVIFAIATMGNAFTTRNQRRAYEAARDRYRHARANLLWRLDSVDHGQ